MKGINDDIHEWHLEPRISSSLWENGRREQTERRMVKYGQVDVSRPCCKISANVQIPGAKILSFEISFMFFQYGR
jgi:hypothetical protein